MGIYRMDFWRLMNRKRYEVALPMAGCFIERGLFLFKNAYLEISIFHTDTVVTAMHEGIRDVFTSPAFYDYIDGNIEYIKRDMMDYIEAKSEEGKLMRDFLLFLAKENEINEAEGLNINHISDIIRNISPDDLITYIRENIRNNYCALVLY